MNRDHAAELIPAFVVDALDEGDRLLVEGLLAIEPTAVARRDRFEALLSLAAVPAPVDPAAHEAGWEALVDRLPPRPDAPTPTAPRELPNVLGGRYVLQEELGRGAVGVVYKATDQQTGATVVVRFHMFDMNSPRSRERQRRHLDALEGLDHPNLLLPIAAGVEDALAYTVLPFLDPLRSLGEAGHGARRWSPAEATRVVRQAGLGLAAAHRHGAVHRDLTPRSLLLEADGTVRVADLERLPVGAYQDSRLTGCGVMLGTPYYLAPEAAMGKGDIDERVDVYALGQILYELLTGRLMFRERTAVEVFRAKLEGRFPDPCQVVPGLPVGYREVLGKALALDPAERYPCVEAFLAEVDAVERGEPVASATASPWRDRRSWLPRVPGWVWPVLVLVGALIALVAWAGR